ncbi:zinc finger, C2H2 type [Cooperia oncophora]
MKTFMSKRNEAFLDGRRKPNRKTKVKRLYTPKRKKKKAVPASVIPVIRPETACYCGVVVCSHARLHEHILYEHSYPTIIRCSQCGASAERVHEHHICSICDVFADNLEEHLKNHYRDRLGSGAFMECRLCCKTFLTVKEVVIHERVSHARVRKLSSYECEYCGDCFATKHVRDNHLLRHFEESIGDIWDRVEQMQ